ncbi:MAG: ABC transporter transmembrane domain-containing protein [Actinomycetota bacterium]
MTPTRKVFAPYVKRHGRSLAGAAVCTVLLTAASLASPWPLKLIIDELLANRSSPFSLRGDDLLLVALVAGLILLIAGVSATADYYSEVWLKRSGEQIVHDLRVALYDHLQRLSLAFHDGQKKGNLVTHVTGDVNSIGQLFSESLGQTVSAVLLLVGMAIVSVIVDPILAFATLGVTPFLFVVTSRYKGRLSDLARRQRTEEGEIASLANETLSAMQVVKAFGSERFEHDRVERRSKSRLALGVLLSRTEARFSGLVDVLGASATALVVIVGVFRVAAGELSPGDLIVFCSYASKTYKPLRDIARQLGKVSRSMVRAERVAEILATDNQLEDRPGAFKGGRAAGEVELRGVTFAYATGRRAVNDISLRIPAGSHIAIVGSSGAGKSTLGALVARFYDPTSGAVLIDGRDARDCSLSWLRGQVGFLLQDTVLFSGTVAANIAYASDAPLSDVVIAARDAHAHYFIAELPAGYETELGPRGVGLSGGQRQRLGIARVLLRDPSILVLDEPTTGLDSTSEKQVIEGLYELMRGRTTIVISHSIALARMADRVLVLEDGQVVEDGPPEDLLRNGGFFERLARTQERPPGRARPTPVPRDPALPELGRLLNTEQMRTALQRSLKPDLRDARMENLRIARVRYQPRDKVTVHYRTTISGQDHHAVATVIANQDLAAKVHRPRYAELSATVDARSPAALPVVHDDELNAIVTWLPFDVKLPGVAAPAPELTQRLSRAGTFVSKGAPGPTILGYKPESRAVMRWGGHILKAYGKDRQFAAALTGLIASDGAASIPSASFVAALEDLRLTVQTALKGTTPRAAAHAAREAGALVRLLQGRRFVGLGFAPPEHQLREAGRHALLAGAVVPDLTLRLEALVERLKASIPAEGALVPAHGDFHVDQLLVDDERIAVIDFDGMCSAPAALDIATYAADVVRGRNSDLEAVTAVLELLLEGYGSPPADLEWHLSVAILARATHPFRAQTADWPQRVDAMVGAAEMALNHE